MNTLCVCQPSLDSLLNSFKPQSVIPGLPRHRPSERASSAERLCALRLRALRWAPGTCCNCAAEHPAEAGGVLSLPLGDGAFGALPQERCVPALLVQSFFSAVFELWERTRHFLQVFLLFFIVI